ncbi:MAG: NUDIX domain-containing protein [Candidatus Micrarchaeota archaeon]
MSDKPENFGAVHRIVAVIFSKNKASEPRFLILHRCLNWNGWELLKGQVEENESKKDALLREIFEETGLKNVRIVKPIAHKMAFFDKVHQKTCEVFGFLVEAGADEAVSLENNLVAEHDDFLWTDRKTVLEKLRFDNMRDFFQAASAEI